MLYRLTLGHKKRGEGKKHICTVLWIDAVKITMMKMTTMMMIIIMMVCSVNGELSLPSSYYNEWGKEPTCKKIIHFFSLEVNAHNNYLGRGFASKCLSLYFFHLTTLLSCVSGFHFNFSLG